MRSLNYLLVVILVLHAPVVFSCVDFDAQVYPQDPNCPISSGCYLLLNVTLFENGVETCSETCDCIGADPLYLPCFRPGTAAIFHPKANGGGGLVEYTSPSESGLNIPLNYIAAGWYGPDYSEYNFGEWWETGYNC